MSKAIEKLISERAKEVEVREQTDKQSSLKYLEEWQADFRRIVETCFSKYQWEYETLEGKSGYLHELKAVASTSVYDVVLYFEVYQNIHKGSLKVKALFVDLLGNDIFLCLPADTINYSQVAKINFSEDVQDYSEFTKDTSLQDVLSDEDIAKAFYSAYQGCLTLSKLSSLHECITELSNADENDLIYKTSIVQEILALTEHHYDDGYFMVGDVLLLIDREQADELKVQIIDYDPIEVTMRPIDFGT